jgi:hypothetical protein
MRLGVGGNPVTYCDYYIRPQKVLQYRLLKCTKKFSTLSSKLVLVCFVILDHFRPSLIFEVEVNLNSTIKIYCERIWTLVKATYSDEHAGLYHCRKKLYSRDYWNDDETKKNVFLQRRKILINYLYFRNVMHQQLRFWCNPLWLKLFECQWQQKKYWSQVQGTLTDGDDSVRFTS